MRYQEIKRMATTYPQGVLGSYDVKLVPRLNNNLLLLLLLLNSSRQKILLSNSFAIQQNTDKRKKSEGWQLPLDP